MHLAAEVRIGFGAQHLLQGSDRAGVPWLGAHVGVIAPTRESRSMYERLGFVLHRQPLPMYGYPLETS